MSDVARRRLSLALVVLASAIAVLALVAGYVLHAGVNNDQFANRATVALHDDNVRNLVAEKITDDVVLKEDQDLLAARPLIESVTSTIVGSRPFTELFRAAVGDLHRALFQRDQDTVTLSVPDVGTVLQAALERLKPALASKLDLEGRILLIQRDLGSVGSGLAHAAHTLRVLTWILFVLCLLLAAGAVWVAPDRREGVSALGVGAAAAGGVLVVLYAIARSIAIHHVSGPDGQAAAAGVWDAFLGDLRSEGWILAGSGAVVAAASASLISPPQLGAPLRRIADRLSVEPRTRMGHALRAGVFIAVGLIVLTQANAVVHLAITIAGLYLIYEGVALGLKLMYRPRPMPVGEELAEQIEEGLEELFEPTRLHHVIAGGVAVAVVAGALVIWLGSGSATVPPPATGACEGNAALCDRSLEEVALPATHNAMSVPLPGWYSAEQDASIADQLDDGIRGLLIDTHYGDKLPDGKVRTELGPTSKLANQDGVSRQAVEAATRIRDNLGFSGQGERGIYLCHSFCELGATPLDSALGDIHDFLVTHPEAVLVVINEDYVKPADFVDAVDRAGLADLAYSGPVGIGEWPTLREMIDSNQRIVFLAEHHAGAAPWYQPAYKSITEETPYHFSSASQLESPNLAASCAPNRGTAKAPLFLVNHWVTTDPLPKPSIADQVNAEGVLMRRVGKCETIRDHFPNLVAVNFYKHGDLFGVVDKLNGIAPPTP